jgi:predicted branched-subunit amino acid permease
VTRERLIDRRAIADMAPLAVPALLVFAGAAQLAAVTLAGVASWWAVVVAVAVINARHVMYSSALAAAFTEQPMWMRLVAPLMLVDQQFALVADRTGLEPAAFRRYYLSSGIAFWVIWQFNTAMGIRVGLRDRLGILLGAVAGVVAATIVDSVLSGRGGRRDGVGTARAQAG